MSNQNLEQVVRDALFSVAPDLEGLAIEPDETFREQFEIDSMDYLNFIIGLSKATGLQIPECDYPKLQTLAGSVAYLKDSK
ncbi:MAG: acyl carrier protein [Methyloligellaceae bacterium]